VFSGQQNLGEIFVVQPSPHTTVTRLKVKYRIKSHNVLKRPKYKTNRYECKLFSAAKK